MKFRKTAFTLVELLVVVSIISIFASLLFPAVQKSREAARREACINNCEQLCLGLHKFENVHGRIPGGNTAPVNSRLTNYFGPQLLLLPYLEQGLAYSNVNLDESIISTQNKLALMAQPPVLLCPSDPHEGHNTITTANPALLSLGWTNYHSNAGSWSHINGWDGVFGPRLTEEERNSGGVGGGGELLPLKLSEITDGLSNTAAFTEVVNGLGYSRARAQKTDCFNLGAPLPSGTLSEVREVLLAKNWVTSSVYHDKVDLNVWRFRGYPFYEGTMWRNWYNPYSRPIHPVGYHQAVTELQAISSGGSFRLPVAVIRTPL